MTYSLHWVNIFVHKCPTAKLSSNSSQTLAELNTNTEPQHHVITCPPPPGQALRNLVRNHGSARVNIHEFLHKCALLPHCDTSNCTGKRLTLQRRAPPTKNKSSASQTRHTCQDLIDGQGWKTSGIPGCRQTAPHRAQCTPVVRPRNRNRRLGRWLYWAL